ncbi:DUF222 domain-containing protein [Arthrobacter sp. UYEF3]|uniref:HNH endonuclease signature motif containing protein n=1 Tax=Arthrobacter sp. UYEF3 TaxID=1756365 RepID=UPI003392AF78
MKSGAALSAETREALAALAASAAALAALADTEAGADCDLDEPSDTDPLRDFDPLRARADVCLDVLAGLERWAAGAAALKVRVTADYVQAAEALAAPAVSAQERTGQEMAVVAEVACVLTVSERTASALICESLALTTALPLTLAALQAGEISWQHARIMVDETSGLDPAGAAALEAHFLDPGAATPARGCPAGELVPGRFRAKARTWRERHHPVSIETRHARSAGDRRVEYAPDRDGMAWLSAYLPAATAAGIWERTTTAARALQGPAEGRTLTQLRADITATWLLTTGTVRTGTSGGMGGSGIPGTSTDGGSLGEGVPVPRAQVLVTVPVLSLLGATDEPAVLDGYGPIPPSMARALVADGADSFYRVLTDPRDGAPLEIGRTSYRLTKALRHWLRLRDGKCPFPGCHNPSLDNDADHLLAWADGGTTGIANLGQPCRKHHRLKHTTAWTPTAASKNHPPGWTSPSGRCYPSEHQDWEPPHWPQEIRTGIDKDPEAEIGPEADIGLGTDPGTESWTDRELPQDPFRDWHVFVASHPIPDADIDDPDWPAPLDDPIPGDVPLQYASISNSF